MVMVSVSTLFIVTEYIVVVEGVAITEAVVTEFKPVAGLHE